MKNTTKFQFSILALVLLLTVSAFAARLPTVSGDSNSWGDVLNTFLQVAQESGGNINSNYITSSMILDATIAARDLASNSINTTHILDATIGAIDIASGAVNNTHILDATIGAIDIASGAVNTTHIVDGTIANADVASNAINGSQVAQTTGFNVSSLIVNVNNTGGRGATAANISGIYINSTHWDAPSIATSTCATVYIKMTGLPQNVPCIPVVDSGIYGDSTKGNISFVGVNSTMSNCRVDICNFGYGGAINPPLALYTAIALVNGGV